VPEDIRLGASCLIILQLHRHIKPPYITGTEGKDRVELVNEWGKRESAKTCRHL